MKTARDLADEYRELEILKLLKKAETENTKSVVSRCLKSSHSNDDYDSCTESLTDSISDFPSDLEIDLDLDLES